MTSNMEAELEVRQSSFIDSEHWSRELKCGVCFDYLNEPHTLSCGHSFCICCLKRLAQYTRDSYTSVPVKELKFYCPACRSETPVKPVIKEDISVNYALREIIGGWKLDKQQFDAETKPVNLRSVSSQTPSINIKWPSNIIQNEVSKPQDHQRVFPNALYLDKLRKTESLHSVQNMPRNSNCGDYYDDTDTDDDYMNFNELDGAVDSDRDEDLGQDQPDEQRDHQPNVDEADDLQILWSPGRVALTLFWFVYTALVAFIAQGFLPYMILYTLMFALILYTENIQRVGR